MVIITLIIMPYSRMTTEFSNLRGKVCRHYINNFVTFTFFFQASGGKNRSCKWDIIILGDSQLSISLYPTGHFAMASGSFMLLRSAFMSKECSSNVTILIRSILDGSPPFMIRLTISYTQCVPEKMSSDTKIQPHSRVLGSWQSNYNKVIK